MKAIAINGSPRANGNTALMLRRVLGQLENAGMETEFIQAGGNTISGCRACTACRTQQMKRCVIDNDPVNGWMQKMFEADVILLGTPSYFSDITSEMKALIDRAGYVAMGNGRLFARKIGAAVCVHRRGGAVCCFDTLNRFFLINGMIVPGSTYWNYAVAKNPGEAAEDEEALRNMDDLAANIAWLAGKIHGGNA